MTLKDDIIAAIQTVYDPEIPINIWEVGLIYDVSVDDAGKVHVLMTLTSPHCPVAETLPIDVRRAVEEVDGVASAEVEITWDPPWDPEMMSEAAKLELGFD
ncbi:MAG: SUF system Fe-S cluster assembly protein [Thermoanaerobaculales bacterium]|jgi:FeS assembly SUF system protein|nr:SUF system Fe-S cluster assembly protein [Thermoanaerobaculales bacterium]